MLKCSVSCDSNYGVQIKSDKTIISTVWLREFPKKSLIDFLQASTSNEKSFELGRVSLQSKVSWLAQSRSLVCTSKLTFERLKFTTGPGIAFEMVQCVHKNYYKSFVLHYCMDQWFIVLLNRAKTESRRKKERSGGMWERKNLNFLAAAESRRSGLGRKKEAANNDVLSTSLFILQP